MLSAGDMAAGDIAARFPVSRPAVSRHLRVLRQAGLVSTREEAQQRIYRIEMAAMDEIDGWIGECRLLWAQRLDDFGRHLDRLAEKGEDQDAGD
jgi:DNA-binding transcriptional ArsR family regulator